MSHRMPYFDNGDVKRELLYSDHEETMRVHTYQDLAPVKALAKDLREQHHVIGHRKTENLTPVAEIPMVVYEQAVREGWDNDEAAWKRWMNDPQNAAFRITSGRV